MSVRSRRFWFGVVAFVLAWFLTALAFGGVALLMDDPDTTELVTRIGWIVGLVVGAIAGVHRWSPRFKDTVLGIFLTPLGGAMVWLPWTEWSEQLEGSFSSFWTYLLEIFVFSLGGIAVFSKGIGLLRRGVTGRGSRPQTAKTLLETIEVYAEAMYYLASCGDFDASKFERLDGILSRAGVEFGPVRRQEMLSEAAVMLPTRTVGGLEELRVQLQTTLAQGFQGLNEMLAQVAPTPTTANEVQRIMGKYHV